MRPLQAAELAFMQAVQVSAMMDMCVIQTYTSTFDTYGAPVITFTDGAPIACGFDPTGGRKNWRADLTALHVDSTVRLPLETAVNAKDRIKIIKRFGVWLSTPLVFDVQGNSQRGPSGLVLELAKVTL